MKKRGKIEHANFKGEYWWQQKIWKYGKLLLIWQDTAGDTGLWQLCLPGCGLQVRKLPPAYRLQDCKASAELRRKVMMVHDLLDREIIPETPPPDKHIFCGWNRFSPFEAKVLEHLARIPTGSVISYGSLAAWAGYPQAARAVGRVMAKNPFPLFYPCHRVVKAGGNLGKYGGGTTLKHRLLQAEGIIFRRPGRISPKSFYNPNLNLFSP